MLFLLIIFNGTGLLFYKESTLFLFDKVGTLRVIKLSHNPIKTVFSKNENKDTFIPSGFKLSTAACKNVAMLGRRFPVGQKNTVLEFRTHQRQLPPAPGPSAL